MRYMRSIPLLAVVAVLALACGEGEAQTPTGSDAALQASAVATQADAYQLVQVAGEPLPVVTEEEEGCREQVTAATLSLEDDGTWTLEVTEREACDGTIEETTEAETGTYTVEGQTIRFAEASDDEDAGEAEAEDDENEAEEDDEEDEVEAEEAELEIDELGVGTLSADGLRVRLASGETTLLFRQ